MSLAKDALGGRRLLGKGLGLPMKIAVFLFLAALSAASFGEDRLTGAEPSENRKASPPSQPANGPGGSDYAHAGFRETEHGEGGRQFWIIEPAQPAPKSAPLVIFIHGWSAMTPDTYRGWVNHLAKRGNIVVYPRYQEKLLSVSLEYLPNVLASVRDALAELSKPGHVKPDLDRVVVAGHSVGGVEAVNYAVVARVEHLPIPKAVMSVQPGQGPRGGMTLVPMGDCAKLAAELKLLVVVGAADNIVGSDTAREIWRGTKQVGDRAFVTMQSDSHGFPPLDSGHLSPVSWNGLMTDALDWNGYWKLLDSLMDAAFSGKKITVDPNMGAWSDSVPVAPMKIER